MARCLVLFASLNQVALLKRLLYRKGVFVEMQRTPHCLSSSGCGFALRCEPHQLPMLREECRNLSIDPGGIFQETGQPQDPRYVSINAFEIDR